MFGKRIELFRLFGFAVRVDLSWVLVAVLVTWSLAAGVFPSNHAGLPGWRYWLMGVLGALGLFASILFHEFAHSLVARRFGLPISGITLFLFGGVAEMTDEPPTPASEFWMAIAGPASSLVLSGLFLGGAWLLQPLSGLEMVLGVLGYLGWINLALVIFNLVPAFPLDGGRVLRSLLWGWRQDIRWATRVVTLLGGWFGLVLVGLGIGTLMRGSVLGGIWWLMIGLFLRQAAHGSYQQIVVRQALQGEPVSRFMNAEPVTVGPNLSVQDLVDQYVYRYHHELYPVVADGQLRGCVTLNRIKAVPQAEWPRHTVAELTENCTEANTVSPETDAVKAFNKMHQSHQNRLLVVEHGSHLLGIVALKDLLRFLSVKLELEQGRPAHAGGGLNR